MAHWSCSETQAAMHGRQEQTCEYWEVRSICKCTYLNIIQRISILSIWALECIFKYMYFSQRLEYLGTFSTQVCYRECVHFPFLISTYMSLNVCFSVMTVQPNIKGVYFFHCFIPYLQFCLRSMPHTTSGFVYLSLGNCETHLKVDLFRGSLVGWVVDQNRCRNTSGKFSDSACSKRLEMLRVCLVGHSLAYSAFILYEQHYLRRTTGPQGPLVYLFLNVHSR